MNCGLFSSDDSKWLSSLEDSDWLAQVSELLQTATQISVAMECDKSSVLISYEDGVDRTAQVSEHSCDVLDSHVFLRSISKSNRLVFPCLQSLI